MAATFFFSDELPRKVLEPGRIERAVKARGGAIMMVEVSFVPGASGAEHSHPHEQATYCLAGEFIFTAGSESRRLLPGDSVYVPGGLRHGTTCVEAGRLLDVFSPQREDFLGD